MATDTTAEQTIDVVTPAAGESVTEGTILEWRVKVGEAIKLDDTIVEISTDKVDSSCPSPASGTVSEILVAGGRHGHRRPGDRAHRPERRRRSGRDPRRCRPAVPAADPRRDSSGARLPRRGRSGPGSQRLGRPHRRTTARRPRRWPRARPRSRAWTSRTSPAAVRRADNQVRRALGRGRGRRRASDQRRERRRSVSDGKRAEHAAAEGRRRGARALHGASRGRSRRRRASARSP